MRNIGVWFDIMETLGKLSIITNALIIALTSEFIPRTVYMLYYSEDQSLNGYVDFSLAHFNMSDLDHNYKSKEHHNITTGLCRYPDYRHGPNDPEPYSPNIKFWHIWFARMLFFGIFVNAIAVVATALKLLIPDVPSKLRHRIRWASTRLSFLIDQQQARGIPHNQSGAGEGERPSVEEESDDDNCLRRREEGCFAWGGVVGGGCL